MSLDVTITYKKPKLVKYNATHAACGSTFMIVPDDVPQRRQSGVQTSLTT